MCEWASEIAIKLLPHSKVALREPFLPSLSLTHLFRFREGPEFRKVE